MITRAVATEVTTTGRITDRQWWILQAVRAESRHD